MSARILILLCLVMVASNVSSQQRLPAYPHAKLVSIESFEEAALDRGVLIDLKSLEITGVIENISDEGVAGTCQYGQHIHHDQSKLQSAFLHHKQL